MARQPFRDRFASKRQISIRNASRRCAPTSSPGTISTLPLHSMTGRQTTRMLEQRTGTSCHQNPTALAVGWPGQRRVLRFHTKARRRAVLPGGEPDCDSLRAFVPSCEPDRDWLSFGGIVELHLARQTASRRAGSIQRPRVACGAGTTFRFHTSASIPARRASE